MYSHEVELYVPRFKLASQFDLSESLKSMGMTLAFAPSKADFSGMDGEEGSVYFGGDPQGVVDVNEEGTEAAAATGIAVNRGLQSQTSRRVPCRSPLPVPDPRQPSW